MLQTSRRFAEDRGFTLAEVCVAIVLLALAVAGVAQMISFAKRATWAARVQTTATILATQKLEQLRSLLWNVDAAGQRLSDVVTDLSRQPPTNGGAGLGASSAGAIDANTPGYVDFLNGRGEWVGTGSTAPPTATFIRRWSIRPLPEDPADTLILQVLVTTVTGDRHAPTPRRRLGQDALVTTMLSRKLR